MPSEYVMNNYATVPESGCWLWLGNWDAWGYGAVKSHGRWLNSAHRVFFTEHHGPIPEDKIVMHKCDTPACVNPGHLFLGTYSENQIDRQRKGRQRVGFSHRPRYMRIAKASQGQEGGHARD